MGSTVEANSLSDITQLASNPPKYPRNPTERRREPLALYIARVPGSRDIILTPLKPQLKNVTVEDVAASLYFLHLNTEDDSNLLATAGADAVVTSSEPLPRKPLHGTARSSFESPQTVVPEVSGSITGFPKRKPVSVEKFSAPEQESTLPAHSLPRKPLGPRPQAGAPAIERKPLPGTENNRTKAARGGVSARSATAKSAEHPDHFQASDTDRGSNTNNDQAARKFSITVIRRDPSSGAQWNIGAISGAYAPEISDDDADHTAKRTRKPYFDMSVSLTSPGYTYFRTGPSDSRQNSGFDQAVPHRQAPMNPAECFYREIHMEGSSFWARSQHKRTRSNLSDITARVQGNGAADTTGISPESLEGKHGLFEGSETKGYIFDSPWDGRCKFTTSSGGRSLRCKHTLPAAISARDVYTGKPAPESNTISELKFNLPSSTMFKSTGSASTDDERGAGRHRFHIPRLGQIRSKLSPSKLQNSSRQPPLDPTSYSAMYPSDDECRPPLPPRPNSDNNTHPVKSDLLHQAQMYGNFQEDKLDSRLDLSIGQEKAGGGNRGKRAKLGKLVIYDEGFKMLDLVVSANMAVWWSVWEK